MKKKTLFVLFLLLTLFTSSLSWADASVMTTKLTHAVEPVSADSFILQNGNAIYLSGIKSNGNYIIKNDQKSIRYQLKSVKRADIISLSHISL
ncbi:hypothetical protein QE109_02430 [Fusibacter bizertensis]|uniref:Uncharacterized protein n=1 Tax=Fusibacter bizertensis TaxID=1488331 RepID=A0ABT6N9B3_9FIRM|nr:hypothetical protein [Fusibacter bizertensis]MDH8676984.1 hypothetical protein [Fusibacter bizertensis]